MSKLSGRNCEWAKLDPLEYEELLARNLELCMGLCQLVEAIRNHELNTTVATGADRQLWKSLRETINAEG